MKKPDLLYVAIAVYVVVFLAIGVGGWTLAHHAYRWYMREIGTPAHPARTAAPPQSTSLYSPTGYEPGSNCRWNVVSIAGEDGQTRNVCRP